jgi:ABC-type nitrate/sulfonate/bicarbonate transport system ATPase subunit
MSMLRILYEVEDLGYRYDEADADVLRHVSFTIPAGESTAIVGVSGRGKSTLLRLLAGLERPHFGSVKWKGQSLSGPTREIGLVFQNYQETVFNWLTVLENIRLAQSDDEKISLREIVRLAHRLGIRAELRKKARDLSGGQRQRVAIARTLLQRAEVVLLDEPFSSLDTLARHDLIRMLHELSTEYRTTFVIVSHDIEEAIAATRRVFCLLHSSEEPQLVVVNWDDPQFRTHSELLHIYAVIHQRAERILGILREDRHRDTEDEEEET